MMPFKLVTFHLLLFVCFIAPQVELFYVISIILLLITFIHKRRNFISSILDIKVALTILLLVSWSYSVLKLGFYFNNDLLKPVVILIIIFCLSENLSGWKINKKFIYTILAILIVSQLAYVFDLYLVKDIIDTVYPYDEEKTVWTHRSVYDLDELSNFQIRAGGIYRNPNQYSKYVNLVFIVFLGSCRYKRMNHVIFSIICLSTILLTGSRTGFAVFLVSSLVYFVKVKDIKAFVCLCFLPLVYIMGNLSLRVFHFSDTLEIGGSLNLRLSGFKYVFNNSSFLELLVGNYYSEGVINQGRYDEVMFDSDLVSLLFSFGVITTIVIYRFYYKIIGARDYWVILPIFIFSFTGGIFQDLNFIILLSALIGGQKLVRDGNYSISKKV